MAFRIVRHVILVVLDNFEVALKVGLLPVLLGQALMFAAAHYSYSYMGNGMGIGMGRVSLLFLLAIVLNGILMAWVAVSWHRYVLLEEEPAGWFPPLPPTLWSYIKAVILLVLLGILVGIAVSLALTLGSALLLPVLSGVSEVVAAAILGMIGIPLGLFIAVAYFRVATILPARAVGDDLSVGEAWDKTRPWAWTLLGVLFVLAALQFLISLILQLAAGFGVAQVIGGVVVSFASILINVSLLTTIYGVAIEGRQLR